jgi:hypothetical protein
MCNDDVPTTENNETVLLLSLLLLLLKSACEFSVGTDGYNLIVGVNRVIKEKERQEHDEQRGKRETRYHVDCFG